MIPPTVDVFKRVPVERLKNVSKWVIEEYKLKTMRRLKDAQNRPVVDWKKVLDLYKQGIVKWPEVSAAYAIENIWDPLNHVCIACDKRCKRGMGTINETSIKRLNG
jgi:hypothetical protein